MIKEADGYIYTKLIDKYLLYLKDPELKRSLRCEVNAKNLKMIQNIMKNAFDNKIVCLLELIGNSSTGKQSTTRRVASALGVDTFLLIDCRIYNTPDLIQQKIYSACGVSYALDEPEEVEDEVFCEKTFELKEEINEERVFQEEIKSSDFWTNIFRNVFEKKKVVMYFSHIDVLCVSNRQTFLYTLLDNLNMSQTRVVVAFATSHLYLMESLDRRIKSRFSAERYFFGTKIDNPAKTIESLLLMKGGDVGIYSSHVADIAGFAKDSTNMQKLIMVVETEGSFDLVVNLLIAFFCRMNAYLMQQLVSKSKNGKAVFDQNIERAMKSVIKNDFESILRSLPKCHLTLLKAILEIAADNPKAELLAYDIGVKITSSKSVTHKYSQNVLLSGLNDLEKMGYIHVSKKPITGESKVTLKMYADFIDAFRRVNNS